VRELRNAIRRACLLASDVIEPEHLLILPAEPCAVAALKVDYKTLHTKMKRFGIQAGTFRSS
jgi:transcriptional regulator with GAF, ATPase, and Fis domain